MGNAGNGSILIDAALHAVTSIAVFSIPVLLVTIFSNRQTWSVGQAMRILVATSLLCNVLLAALFAPVGAWDGEIDVTEAVSAATALSAAAGLWIVFARNWPPWAATAKVRTAARSASMAAVDPSPARPPAPEKTGANEEKPNFLATLGHEIRTSLTGVVGYTELLLQSRGIKGPDRNHLEHVRTSSNSLLTLVNDLLDLSKIEAGKAKLQRIPFSPAAIAREAAGAVSTDAARKGLGLETIIEESTPDAVEGDPDRIRQVLLNLLVNAVKFTPSGRVTLIVSRLPSPFHERLRFEVRDTGIGISRQHQGRLFEPFSRVEDMPLGAPGTGLGLAICKGLVESMGGKISVESEEGAGARFWFESPLPEADPASLSPCDCRQQSPQTRADRLAARVLVVDDVSMNRMLVSRVLETLGHTVALAHDGREAISRVRAERFDLVLMDLRMPDMDGIAATRAIRALEGPASRAPIYALTANVRSQEIAACREAGLNGFLAKPFRLEELQALVAKTIADGRHAQNW